MKALIKDAKYAAGNLSTLCNNVYSYASYARRLCSVAEGEDSTLYEKVSKAQAGITELAEYINGKIEKIENNDYGHDKQP